MDNKKTIVVSLIENLKHHVNQLDLQLKQKEAFASFVKNGFPSTDNEEWKYTSLKKVVNEDYLLSQYSKNNKGVAMIESSVIQKYSLGFNNKIIFHNGVLVNSPKIKGVKISNDILREKYEDEASTPLTNLNFSLANSGYSIEIDKNTVVDEPIEILFFNSEAQIFGQYRNFITLDKGASVKFIEKLVDLSKSRTFINSFTQINCEVNSKLEFNKIQNNHDLSSLIDHTNVSQEKDSVCEVNTLIFSGGFIRNNLNFKQNGSNCESNMSGISLLDKNQFADNHTFVDHKKANCRSNEMYKGIYLDSSKGVFNGKIMVRKDAQKIDAFQSNNNLLLSETSTIDSKPQLEIYADDVKCSHGCTIGQLDDEALFYMRSRGIRKKEAQAVLTYAFASEVVENISIAELKKFCQNLVAKKLDVDLDFS
tara:strand:- start:4069 stop:5337 length:1269 start_codon:yes stop_codon:yes gene_type:complete